MFSIEYTVNLRPPSLFYTVMMLYQVGQSQVNVCHKSQRFVKITFLKVKQFVRHLKDDFTQYTKTLLFYDFDLT